MAKAKVVKWGPRTAATRRLWEAADRAWLLRDHPADCPVCAGTNNDPDKIVSQHAAHQAALVEQMREAVARRKSASEAYYIGGFKMVCDAPMRLAAHVAKWKPSNKAALGLGSDPYGLVLGHKSTPSSRKRCYMRSDLPPDLLAGVKEQN